MAFFVLLVYTVFIFIRPHEWGLINSSNALPFGRYFLIMAFAIFILKTQPKRYSELLWLLGGFCIIIVLSSIRNGWFSGGFYDLLTFIPASIIPFLLCSNLVNTIKKQELIMWCCLVASMMMVSNGLSQIESSISLGWAGSYAILNDGVERITYLGLFVDPNDLGMFLVMNIPFACYFLLHKTNFFIRFISLPILLSLFYGIYLTNSRGTLVGVFVLMMAYGLYRYGKGKVMLIAAALTPVAMIVLTSFRAIDAGEESASLRTDAWYSGIEMLISQPFFGIGKGNFLEYHDLTAHNSFVLVMAELGVLGYGLWFCFLGIMVMMLATGLKFSRSIRVNYPEKIKLHPELLDNLALNSTLFFSLIGFFATSFFLSRSYIVFLYIFSGLAVASYYRIIQLLPDLAIEKPLKLVPTFFALSIASIVGMYLLIKILI